MVQLDLSAYRRAHRWRVEETGECLFLIDVDLPDPNTADMQHLLEVADQQHWRIRAALNISPAAHKDKERQRRVNVWLYSPRLLEEAGLVRAAKPNMFYGTVNSVGLHLITREMAWDDLTVLDKVLHEAVHYWWCDQAGEAPSLLNEGVAAYFERILTTHSRGSQSELIQSWRKYAGSAKPGFLRRLCKNETFWSEDAAGEPVYEVGGQLVSFLLDRHGLLKVQQVFLESHFDDPHLAEHIEEVTGESIDSLEQQITRRRLLLR